MRTEVGENKLGFFSLVWEKFECTQVLLSKALALGKESKTGDEFEACISLDK